MRDSQRLAIQRFMAAGKPITPLIAWKLCRCFTLSQRIGEIKREFTVRSRMVMVGGKRVAEYWIPAARERVRAMCSA
jgi:hypothetical protein